MKKLSTFLDYLITLFFVFLISLFVSNFFLKTKVVFAISSVVAVIYSMIFFKVKNKIFKKSKVKNETKLKLSLLKDSLLYQTDEENLNFFKGFFNKLFNFNLQITSGTLENQSTIIFPFFEKEQIDFTDLLKVSKIAREKKKSRVIVACLSSNCDDSNFSKMFESFTTFNSDMLYENMVNYDYFPKLIEKELLPKKNVAEMFKMFFSRQKARGYAVTGVVLLLFSLLTPFKKYYIIFASVLLCLSVIITLVKKE